MGAAKWLIFGAGAYLLFLLASVPAGTAYALLPQSTPVQAAGLTGSLWSGQAAVASVAGIGLHEVRWELSPWSLLLGRLRGSLNARLADGFVSSRVVASATSLQLTELRASTRLSNLGPQFTQILGSVAGQVSVSLASLTLTSGNATDAAGEIRVLDLSVPPLFGGREPGLIPLGSYSVQLLPTGGQGLSARIVDDGGPLAVTGTLTLDLERRYRLEGLVQPRDGAVPELEQGLRLMSGDPDPMGRYQLSLTGSL